MGHNIGERMHSWAEILFPLCRSLTGKGVKQTLDFLKSHHSDLVVHSIKSGTKVFDWEIPNEWDVNEAYIEDLNGKRVIDFANHNLHLVSYSTPVNSIISNTELQNHLFSIPSLPDAIPYVTSYYQENWGFCLSQKQRDNLVDDFYKVKIDSNLFKGELNYAELLVPGKSTKEIVFSTYICHPSMANNELSGIVLSNALINYVKGLNNSYYSYRFLFLPETIGSIAYINFNLNSLKRNVICGFILTCVGNEDNFSFMPSRTGNTYADKIAKFLLENYYPEFMEYTFLDRGSDERQFCSPNVDLPFVSIMKSKYKEFKEYHTSLDNLSFITPKALGESFELYSKTINIIESNFKFLSNVLCEPMLSKRGLYPNLGGQVKNFDTKLIKDIIALSDGNLDLIDLSGILKVDYFLLKEKVELLCDLKLIKRTSN